ncbi:MAG: hypothetical protein KI790_00585 [Cyclobacteriaceae bacterium]|nr:hypothetical protein [Cyclobacteriaceae bacterium HetDA_MAG_MS6]
MKTKTFYVIVSCISILSCSDDSNSRYPMQKRYWNTQDYDQVIRQIKYHNPKEERYPEFSNPKTAPVIQKLVDVQNFLVVLTDDQLGVNHRSKQATDFFEEYKQLSNAYYVIDRQDNFVYGEELIAIMKFGLELQLHYFKLGNDDILKDADDPNAPEIQRLVKSNERTITKNFNRYLDFVNKETGLDEKTLRSYCDGISVYFNKLYSNFSNADPQITIKKAELMLNKTKNDSVRDSLTELLSMLKKV